MTHFIGLVVGPDIDGQLARYDEQIEVPRYKDYIGPPEEHAPGEFYWPWRICVERGIALDDLPAVLAVANESSPHELDEQGVARWLYKIERAT